jgi:hypothetical protein
MFDHILEFYFAQSTKARDEGRSPRRFNRMAMLYLIKDGYAPSSLIWC